MNAEELAGQLRKPHGEHAADIGKNMYESNINMISNCIDKIQLNENSTVLELGFGNGSHLKSLFENYPKLNYRGLELSQEMINEAKKLQLPTQLILTDGSSRLNFPENHFDAFFSANTVYFWTDISLQLSEIFRVLKPNGQISLSFVKKEFAEKLPFTQFHFKLYSETELHTFLEKAGFGNIQFSLFTEMIKSKNNQMVNREYFVLTAAKNA